MFGRARNSWNRWLGARGERAAARFLRSRGLRIIARNVVVDDDEIDLIAREGDLLVFVEVKTRRRGDPAAAVDLEKKRRICRAALRFAKRNGLLDPGVPWRYDVVAIVWPGGRGRPTIEHERHAFESVGPRSMFG